MPLTTVDTGQITLKTINGTLPAIDDGIEATPNQTGLFVWGTNTIIYGLQNGAWVEVDRLDASQDDRSAALDYGNSTAFGFKTIDGTDGEVIRVSGMNQPQVAFAGGATVPVPTAADAGKVLYVDPSTNEYILVDPSTL
jgi:hypothetical protein